MKQKIFLITNVLVPLMAGFLIYVALDRNLVVFSGLGIKSDAVNEPEGHLGIIRSYLPDLCWAYSLTFGVRLCLGKDTQPVTIGVIAVSFAILMELLQISEEVAGTFDICDIAVEIIAVLVAVFIMNRFSGGQSI